MKKYASYYLLIGLLLGILVLNNVSGKLKPKVLLEEKFEYPNGLLTNEYAYWNSQDTSAHFSPIWELTSGSLFAQDGVGYSGVPDSVAPDRLSTKSNNSAVFRLTTKSSDFENVEVKFDLWNEKLSSTPKTLAQDGDGIYIILRYQSEYNLYYVAVNRRDNQIIIKKKVPGGPSNAGTYYDLSLHSAYVVPYQSWQSVRATVQNNSDESVTIELYLGNVLMLTATDRGQVGGLPITTAGKVGIRADNTEFKFKNFIVSSL